MISIPQLAAALRGIRLMAAFSPSAWNCFDKTPAGFWGSFVVAFALLPLNLIHVLLQFQNQPPKLAVIPYLVVEALADGAVAAGLPRALATPLAQKMLSGSMALLEQQGLHPGQLKDMVSSPAGTTIAGLRVLEQAGLRSALIEAVLSASERSRALR